MNALIEFVRKDGKSIRQRAKELGVSHAHLAKMVRGEVPVTWQFAAIVAQKTGMDYLETFRLAGLLPESETK